MPAEQEAPFTIRSIAVIGAGRTGRAFAFRCVSAGFHVTLEDVMPSNLRRAQDEYAELGSGGTLGNLRYAGTVEEAVADADLAVDFVPDELESKLEIFSLLDRMAPPRTILCTPTQALSITDLASCTYRAGHCLALRSSGKDLLDAAEVTVVRSRFAEEEVVAAVESFLTQLGLKARSIEDNEAPMLVKNTNTGAV